MTGPDKSVRKLVAWGAGGFLVTVVVFLFVASAIRPDTQPGFALTDAATAQTDGTFQITIDVKDRETWVGVDLLQGRAVAPGDPADLLARRYILRAPAGALDLGEVPLETATARQDADWVRDEAKDGEPQNPALTRWYDYSYLTHLLESRGSTFAVRLTRGGVAYLKVLSYYCEPDGSGCLTIRYRLDRDG